MAATITLHLQAIEALLRQTPPRMESLAEGHGHISALRKILAAAIARAEAAVAGCALCSELSDVCFARSTARDPDSLPKAAYQIIPSRLLQTSRCLDRIRCRACETPYEYYRGYEFLVNGSEDEECLVRLSPGDVLTRLEASLKKAEEGYQGAPRWIDDKYRREAEGKQIRLALEADFSEVLVTARAAARAALLAVADGESEAMDRLVASAAPLVAAQDPVMADCAVCRLLPAREEPRPPLGKYINPKTTYGLLPCPWCGTPYCAEGARALSRLTISDGVATLSASASEQEIRAAISTLHDALDLVRLDGPRRAADADDPLHFCVHNAVEEGVRALLHSGFDPDSPDGHQWTPLMRAAQGSKLEIMTQLTSAGADLDVTNLIGETALYLAAEHDQSAAVEMLLAAGADRSVASTGHNDASRRLGLEGVAPAGTTPLDIAKASDNAAIVTLLEGDGSKTRCQ